MADIQHIGHKIRKLREARGLSQADVAKLLDMGQQGYSCYETNINTIPLAKFFKLCEIFGISAGDITTLDEHEVAPHVTA